MLVSLYELLKCVDAHGQAVSAGAIAALVELLLGSTTNAGSGGGGNDLAVDIIALLRGSWSSRPVRAVVASLELVTRLVES
jgi:hypothetical protein